MEFETIVIGAGPGGIETARILGRAGQKVALIEYRDIGGTCVNRGCIPAKTMLFSAEMFRLGKKIKTYGIRFCEDTPYFDFAGMVKKRQEIIEHLHIELTELCKKDGVTLIHGKAELLDQNSVKVGNDLLVAKNIVLASGGSARKFEGFIDGDPRFLISDNIFELSEFPESILIVGGGPVGTEFATFFNTFGVKVTLVDASPVLMNYFDHELGTELARNFKEQGIDVISDVKVVSIDSSSSSLMVTLSNGQKLTVDKIMSAIGVVATTDYFKATGVNLTPANRVEVNQHMQTNFPNVYALGDLVGKAGSAYGAEREGCYIAHHILGEGYENYNLDYIHFPDVVFTDPELATCGYSEQDLQKEGREYYILRAEFKHNAKALIKGDARGFCKIIVEKNSDVILGVHILGPQATEIIHNVPIVLDTKLTVKQWRRYVWGHPVLAEIIKETLSEYGNKT